MTGRQLSKLSQWPRNADGTFRSLTTKEYAASGASALAKESVQHRSIREHMAPKTPPALLLTHHKLSSVFANEFACVVCRLIELSNSSRTCLPKLWKPGKVCRLNKHCCLRLGIASRIDGAQSYMEKRPPTLPAANESAQGPPSRHSQASALLHRVLPRWSMAVHVLRDPYEAVVSGYLYHRRGAEAYWTSHPLVRSQGAFTPLRGTAQASSAASACHILRSRWRTPR